ncbi:MAG: hypothetical protein KF712_21590 [Akkermansiaceae bacterium]|nr:hypothetical protein [Akkermansiaceae bacterium]
MGRPYRKASRQTLVWLVICLCGVAGQIALMMSVPAFKTMGPVQAFALGSLPFFVALALAYVVTGRLKRGRFRRISGTLTPMGFDLALKPGPEGKKEFFAPLEPLQKWMDLRPGADGIEWFGTRTGQHGEVRLFEYEYVTGTGKGTQIHMRTIVAFPADRQVPTGCALGRLDGFRVARMSWWTRRLWAKHSLKDGVFGRLDGWVSTGDAETGRLFLSPGVMDQLRSAPRGESWYIGGGWVCCVYDDPLEPQDLVKFMDRAWHVFSAAGAAG